MIEGIETDDVDELIIAALMVDGRASFREIARQIAVSEYAVRRRVRRLQAAGAIRVGVVLDLIGTGRTITAWVRAAVSAPHLDRVAQKLSMLETTSYVATTVGQYNLSVMIHAADIDGLLLAVDSHVATIPGVIEVDMKIIGKIVSHDFHNAVLGPIDTAISD